MARVISILIATNYHKSMLYCKVSYLQCPVSMLGPSQSIIIQRFIFKIIIYKTKNVLTEYPVIKHIQHRAPVCTVYFFCSNMHLISEISRNISAQVCE